MLGSEECNANCPFRDDAQARVRADPPVRALCFGSSSAAAGRSTRTLGTRFRLRFGRPLPAFLHVSSGATPAVDASTQNGRKQSDAAARAVAVNGSRRPAPEYRRPFQVLPRTAPLRRQQRRRSTTRRTRRHSRCRLLRPPPRLARLGQDFREKLRRRLSTFAFRRAVRFRRGLGSGSVRQGGPAIR
jgi:hypothetical protein